MGPVRQAMAVPAALAMSLAACQARAPDQRKAQQTPAASHMDEHPAPGERAEAPAVAAGWFEAVVAIDATPGGKGFQGVWLVRDDGSRLVVDYRPRAFWRPFEGRRVIVEGERYTPPGQAIMADHYRVEHIRVADIDYQSPSKADVELALIELWGERSYEGKFVTEVIGPGRKLSGTSFTWFIASSGERYLVYDQTQQLPLDVPVRILARRVEPSPFIARLGGLYLWILDIDEPAR